METSINKNKANQPTAEHFEAPLAVMNDERQQAVASFNDIVLLSESVVDAAPDNDYPQALLSALSPLELEQDKILSSSLTASQKKRLNLLHVQLHNVLEIQPRNEQNKLSAEHILDKIDDIMQVSFKLLSDADKARMKSLERQIDLLFASFDG